MKYINYGEYVRKGNKVRSEKCELCDRKAWF